MKKSVFCVICCLLVFMAVPALAETPQWIPPGTNIPWPPPTPTYDIPVIGYDVDTLGIVAESFKLSAKAIASKSLWLMFLCMSIGAIPMILRYFLFNPLKEGVRRRQFNRKVKAEDIRLNHDEVVADKARDMALSNEARQQFRAEHRDVLLTQKIHDMEFNAEATDLFKRQNSGLLSLRRIQDMKRNLDDRKAFKHQYEDAIIGEKVHDMEISSKARDIFKRENKDSIIMQRVTDMENNLEATQNFKSRNWDSLVAAKVRDMELNHEAREKYNELHYNEYEEIDKQARRMEVNLKAKGLFHSRNFDEEVSERIELRLISHAAEMEYNNRYPENYMEKRAQYEKMASDYYELKKYKR